MIYDEPTTNKISKFSDFNIKSQLPKGLIGNKIEIYKVLNKPIVIEAFRIRPSKYNDKGNGQCLQLQIKDGNDTRVIFSGSGTLMNEIQQVPKDAFPFTATIVKEENYLCFT